MNSLQSLVDAMNKTASNERANYHLTLGDLVSKLKEVDASMPVIYDFMEPSSPSAPESYRGYYCDLSFPPSDAAISAGELLIDASDAIGSTFEGYKGGDFTMHSGTPLWASAYGTSSGVGIMDAKVIGERLVLITKQID